VALERNAVVAADGGPIVLPAIYINAIARARTPPVSAAVIWTFGKAGLRDGTSSADLTHRPIAKRR
jgi:hypothetical protein